MESKKITRKHHSKMFQCTGFGDCSMTFTRAEHLARHRRKHTGEKPFQCDVCGKFFSRVDNLKQHRATVHAGHIEGTAKPPMNVPLGYPSASPNSISYPQYPVDQGYSIRVPINVPVWGHMSAPLEGIQVGPSMSGPMGIMSPLAGGAQIPPAPPMVSPVGRPLPSINFHHQPPVPVANLPERHVQPPLSLGYDPYVHTLHKPIGLRFDPYSAIVAPVQAPQTTPSPPFLGNPILVSSPLTPPFSAGPQHEKRDKRFSLGNILS